MNSSEERIRKLSEPEQEERLATLYGRDAGQVEAQKARYAALLRRHAETFGETERVLLVSAPGRT